MSDLIDDLIQLSHFGKVELDFVVVDLDVLVHEVLDSMRHNNPSRQVKVSSRALACVTGDGRLIKVVFENLLGNAWKYTSKTTNPMIDVGSTKIDGELVYYVKDNGAGFDMAYVDKLFGAFQRLHTASEFEGTGIGLATVQRIIHRHNGRIWAIAKPNEGAIFYFTLSSNSSSIKAISPASLVTATSSVAQCPA